MKSILVSIAGFLAMASQSLAVLVEWEIKFQGYPSPPLSDEGGDPPHEAEMHLIGRFNADVSSDGRFTNPTNSRLIYGLWPDPRDLEAPPAERLPFAFQETWLTYAGNELSIEAIEDNSDGSSFFYFIRASSGGGEIMLVDANDGWVGPTTFWRLETIPIPETGPGLASLAGLLCLAVWRKRRA